MTTDTKLTKVLEYLIKNEEEKARELLHQVFIEKARAIHEELMSADESAEEEMDEMHDGMHHGMHDEMDENVGGSGDMGKDLTMEIDAMDDEIDAEETMNEESDDDAEMEVDADVEMSEPAADSADFAAVDDKMSELESALAALKAEFDKLEAGKDEDSDEETVDFDMKSDDDAGEEEVEGEVEVDDEGAEEEEGEEGSEEEEMDESWELDEDFDDLAESLDLEVVTKDMEKSAQTPHDVGSAASGMGLGKDAKSPTPPSQTTRFGAKPVEIGKGPEHKGYNLETAPKSGKLPIEPTDNRRKKATQDTKKMSKEGAPSAKLNHPEPAQGNKMSPLSKGGDNLK